MEELKVFWQSLSTQKKVAWTIIIIFITVMGKWSLFFILPASIFWAVGALFRKG